MDQSQTQMLALNFGKVWKSDAPWKWQAIFGPKTLWKWPKLIPHLPHINKIWILQKHWSIMTNPILSNCSKKTLPRIGGHHPEPSLSIIPTEGQVQQCTRWGLDQHGTFGARMRIFFGRRRFFCLLSLSLTMTLILCPHMPKNPTWKKDTTAQRHRGP